MPEYKAKEYLLHNGEIVQVGKSVELTAEQAALLGDKVGPTKKAELEAKTVPELKEVARDRGVEGYADMKKAELVEALKEE